ncbi:MutS-related protein [Parafilimonas sp.]|uniref:MutS-related protein n=1 Tax=Parafilimonas sp. TaxID=1969739 RepID=UPI003F81A96D
MKPHLLYRDKDFNIKATLPWNVDVLAKDLELQVLFDCMSGKDELLAEVVSKVVHTSIGNDAATILYRQEILKDCIALREIVQAIYELSITAIESRKNSWFGVFTSRPSSVLSGSVGMMGIYAKHLRQLRAMADEHIDKFQSEGFHRFLVMLRSELNDDYFAAIGDNLAQLSLKGGIRTSIQLTKANKGIGYVLHRSEVKKLKWWQWLFPPKLPGYNFQIHPRDESGTRALDQLNDQAINRAANALAQANEHIQQFFILLRQELAFYLGCMNLYNRLKELDETVAYPMVTPPGTYNHYAEELYDPCLALSMGKQVVSNHLNADYRRLVIITGANQGGKSTFLRSIGVAQLMMQSGMFVSAKEYCADIVNGVFTHFKKEEDRTMQSGKFDEELSRMNEITDHLRSGCLILFNESFAATNEREGSEIVAQIVTALIEKDIKVFFVTHLYDFAMTFYEKEMPQALFLRAGRMDDASRGFQLTEAAPLPTSYGPDLYKRIFSDST